MPSVLILASTPVSIGLQQPPGSSEKSVTENTVKSIKKAYIKKKLKAFVTIKSDYIFGPAEW